MKVIEAASFGGADVLELKEVPSPAPGKDSLLVDVKAAGVNYLDLVARAGFMPASFPAPPFRLGHKQFEGRETVGKVLLVP